MCIIVIELISCEVIFVINIKDLLNILKSFIKFIRENVKIKL